MHIWMYGPLMYKKTLLQDDAPFISTKVAHRAHTVCQILQASSTFFSLIRNKGLKCGKDTCSFVCNAMRNLFAVCSYFLFNDSVLERVLSSLLVVATVPK